MRILLVILIPIAAAVAAAVETLLDGARARESAREAAQAHRTALLDVGDIAAIEAYVEKRSRGFAVAAAARRDGLDADLADLLDGLQRTFAGRRRERRAKHGLPLDDD